MRGTYAYQTSEFQSLGEGILAVFSQRFSSVSSKLIWLIVGAEPFLEHTVSFFGSGQEETYTPAV